MSYKTLAGIFAVWIVLALVNGVFAGQFDLTVDPTQQTIQGSGNALNEIMSGQVVNFKSQIGPIPLPAPVPVPNPAYFVALFNLATFASPLFDYNVYMQMIRWIFFFTITGPFTYKILEAVLPSVWYLVGQAASAVGSIIQRFIPIR